MASLEVVALDTVTPQLRAPAVGDTYALPRMTIMPSGAGVGYWFDSAGLAGISKPSAGSNEIQLLSGSSVVAALNSTGQYFNTALNFSFGASYGGATGDVGFARSAAGVLKITNGAAGSGVLLLPTFTVATLPAAATAGAGARATVTDSTVVAAANFGAIVAGAGANTVPVYSDATNWRIG